jgi:iron complex outermembrane receptor protein
MSFVKSSPALAVALLLSPMADAAEEPMAEEVVVTAPRSEAPLTVKTNPKAPRQPVPAHDGADYLKTIPGFSVIRKGGTDGDPVFRGMAGSRLNILQDGQTILGGCGGRMDPPTAYVFPAAYDQITVLKGPQTVLYGPGNSAGTVLFERKINRAQQVGTSGSGSLMLGSFGRNDELAEARTGSENYYLQAIGTRSQMGDYKDGNGNTVHSSYLRWSGNAALGWTPDADTRLELSGAKSDGRAAYADRAMDGAKFARDNLGLKLERKNLSPLVGKIEGQVYYNYVDHVMDNYSLRPFVANMMMPKPAVANPDRTTTGARAAVGLNLLENTSATFGVDFQRNRHTNRNAMNQLAMPYQAMPRVQDALFRNTGVFGEVRQGLSDASRVIGGLRLDNWNAQDSRATVATGMNMVANPTANQSRNETLTSGFARYENDFASQGTWYLGAGHTARAPDYWELISKESATTVSAFNTRPEKTNQLDAGVNYRDGALSGSLSMFYSKVTDYILVQSNVNKGTMMMPRLATIARNISATTWGGEAGLGYQFSDAWRVDGTLAYVQGRNDTDGTALGQIPPLEARLAAAYDDKVWSFGMLLRGVAAQNRFAPNQGNIAGQDIGRTGGFSVFSVNGGFRPSKKTQLTAGVDNLFNKAYAEAFNRAGSPVQGFVTTTRVNEMGRNIWVKANIAFD